MRFDVVDLVFGRLNLQAEYVVVGPLSIEVQPQYFFGAPGAKGESLDVSGLGIGGELGIWIEGRPMRGYFLKGHVEYDSVKYTSNIDEVRVPRTIYGAKFGSQSIIGGFLALQFSIGIGYDSQHGDRTILRRDGNTTVALTIPDSSIIGNGIDLLGGIAIGAAF